MAQVQECFFKIIFDLEELRSSGLKMDDVDVHLQHEFDRSSNLEIENMIETSWHQKCSQNPQLFNALKFRFGGCSVVDSIPQHLSLDLGLTNYRDYVGTHLLDEQQFAQLVEMGEVRGNRTIFLSCALGCEAVLRTCDDDIILLRRTCSVATHAGLYNGPSGHPEPASIIGLIGNEINSFANKDWSLFHHCDSSEVVHELFSSVIKEVCSETGLDSKSLSEPLLIGIMADDRDKPDLLFSVSTSLSATQVCDIYALGEHSESWESDKLLPLPWRDIETILSKQGVFVTAVTRAAISCESIRRQNENLLFQENIHVSHP